MLRKILNYYPFYMPILIGSLIAYKRPYLHSLINNKFNYTCLNPIKNMPEYCEECGVSSKMKICHKCWLRNLDTFGKH